MKPRKTTEQRFWEKVDRNGPVMPHMTTPCWNWLAGKSVDGYGTFSFSGRTGKAHRFSYLLHIGPIPEGMEVRHICHNPACSNPDHLQLGTHTENMHDLALSGRRKGFRIKYKRPLKYKPTPEERFWSKVNKDGPTMPHMDSPCWTWTDWLDINGYGRISVSGKLILAHRFSYELSNGPIPKGMNLLHLCDNPTCLRSDHLMTGTQADNIRDMIQKGRHVAPKGEKNSQSKLTQIQVNEIRDRSTSTTQVQLAKEYGVSQAAIWYILNNRNWKV